MDARPKASKASECVVVPVIVPVVRCWTTTGGTRAALVSIRVSRHPGLVLAVDLAHLTAMAAISLELRTATQENVKHSCTMPHLYDLARIFCIECVLKVLYIPSPTSRILTLKSLRMSSVFFNDGLVPPKSESLRCLRILHTPTMDTTALRAAHSVLLAI